MLRVNVKSELLHWATERAGLPPESLEDRFPRFREWEEGVTQPTLKQLEAFAKATRTPLGFFFLSEPPEEQMPLPDFRTARNVPINRPSPDLLETIYICQQRQEWYREHARSQHADPVQGIASTTTSVDVVTAARTIRETIGISPEERRLFPTWTEALRALIQRADEFGILVMVSGIVGSNTSRTLDASEFRGFALSDTLAPLIFVNGADTKAGQMFTLAHEIAHLWLGQSGVSNSEPGVVADENHVEQWCNRVAAEMLVPLESFQADYDQRADIQNEVNRLARIFKVSTLVIIRRMHDAGGLSANKMWVLYQAELKRLQEIQRGSGGDFYRTQGVRTGHRFTKALITSALEGQTLHRDALHMLGFSSFDTFKKLALKLGIKHALPS